jgi:hypothetical protein
LRIDPTCIPPREKPLEALVSKPLDHPKSM